MGRPAGRPPWVASGNGQQEQESTIKSRQSGFTLVEIAVVLVLMGLLLVGIAKGQELINSAKVKSLASDFRNVQMYVQSYHVTYKALPGDQRQAALDDQFGTGQASAASDTSKLGNAKLDDAWNAGPGSETNAFWQHVRLARLVSGPVSGTTNFMPLNAEGGLVGIQSGFTPPIADLEGSFAICSSQILGRTAKQLDLTLDDGVPNTGDVMLTETAGTGDFTTPQAAVASVADIDSSGRYTVCQRF